MSGVEKLTVEVVQYGNHSWSASLYDGAGVLAAQVAGESREAVLTDIADELGACYAPHS